MKRKWLNGVWILLILLFAFTVYLGRARAEEGDNPGEEMDVTITGDVNEPTITEEPEPTEEPTVTEEPSPTPSLEPTATPETTPTEEPSPTLTETPAPTEEPTPTPTGADNGVSENPDLTPTPSPEPSRRDRIYVDFLMEKDEIENDAKTVIGKIRKALNIREEDVEKLPGWLRTGYSTFLVVGTCLIPLSVIFGIVLAKSHKENRKWVKRGYFGFCLAVPAVITLILIGLPCLCLFLAKSF